jgi:hypothetical protein
MNKCPDCKTTTLEQCGSVEPKHESHISIWSYIHYLGIKELAVIVVCVILAALFDSAKISSFFVIAAGLIVCLMINRPRKLYKCKKCKQLFFSRRLLRYDLSNPYWK